ncbi:acetyl/propionyl-CoA carboxylase subunit alpha [Yinghuangia sp. ASG 101]|uniref:ATP-binding protein n=1 Tax=Yinghuangia sp. ASG 101 TaxID=2896848 RepID=UPI001E4E6F9F|nr:biotin carboxylase N-terminal domain-containing protein [Yinghuangia sp. ASG 101]UGQ13637.1 acetyl/propionyl-CoA carboxylase subunit alpha [Yinghuangia sp. ASG 101]
MFDTVLVANRGEIACRVVRTLREHGIRSAVVFTDADAGARHVRDADTAVRVPDYLDIDAVVAAAVRVGADAVHPGYGFLAENAKFARAVVDAGLVFIGPPAQAIELMGDKIRAKQTVAGYGVPVVPGSSGTGLGDAELAAEARKIGFPVLLKPSAGGGGKGMHLVREETALGDEIAAARREAAGAFGDDTLLVERWIDRPRHIEVQVMADTHGNVVHLGERECSLQRRHQKIIEEAPSVLLTAERRAAMGAAAVEAARSCGYVGAGTVEFIVSADRPDEYFFMEMNTRLQVEHPVTEAVTGLDLVWCQVSVAAGRELGFGQGDVRLDGHAVEARVYAEDPARGFLPGGGRVVLLREPAADGRVRVDSGLLAGGDVGSAYDPMLAKVVAWGRDRDEALRTLRTALGRTTVLGVHTNIAFLDRLLAHEDVVAGRLDTGLVEASLADLTAHPVPPAVAITAALLAHAAREPAPDADGWADPFAVPSGWRLGEHAPTAYRFRVDGAEPVEVRVHGRGPHTEVAYEDAAMVPAHIELGADGSVLLDHDGLAETYWHATADDGSRWIAHGPDTWRAVAYDPVDAGPGATAAGDGTLVAPMPGTVTVVKAAIGDRVTLGQAVVVVEAMKMEHAVTAPFAGTLGELRVDAGARVALDEVLAVVHPDESAATGASDDGEAAGAARTDPAERHRNKNCEDKS